MREQGARIQSAADKASGYSYPALVLGRAGMLLLYCPPATPQCTSPAVTLGNYSLFITHSDTPVMGIMERLTAY